MIRSGKGGCSEWDLWYAYFWASQKPSIGTIYIAEQHWPDRIKWIDLIAVHLFSIKSVDEVVKLMEQLRSTQHQDDPVADRETRGTE